MGARHAFYNVIRQRYLQSTRFANNATEQAERKKFESLLTFFRTYSKQYDLDYLLMAAQGYQESRLDQNAKSHVGAVGVMQVMPRPALSSRSEISTRSSRTSTRA